MAARPWGIWKKLPRARFGAFVLSLVLLVVVASWVAFKVSERRFVLNAVPQVLQVTSVLYRQEASWGFGPGGNEAGIRVYALPPEVAQALSQQGIAFFNTAPAHQQPPGIGPSGGTRVGPWAATPVVAHDRWPLNKATGRLDIFDYICAYGFCIDIDPAVVAQATAVVNSQGNYYAFGRVGLWVVSPGLKRVLYLYNG